MRERWLRIGILAGVLLAICVIGRLVVRIWFDGEIESEERVAWITLGAVGVVLAGVAIWWARLRTIGVVVADIAGAAIAAGLVNLLFGPFINGTTPAQLGAGALFEAAWQYAAAAGLGTLIGLLLLIAAGKDYKSQSLKRFAEAKLTKPRRPVRR
ncbi:MAG TPA: hypothetical protein VIL37_12770 [Natronosporangium sp.]